MKKERSKEKEAKRKKRIKKLSKKRKEAKETLFLCSLTLYRNKPNFSFLEILIKT